MVESTLSFDEILGGDLRIAEWQASLIPGRLEKAAEVDALCKKQAEAAAATLPEGTAVAVIPGGECTVKSYFPHDQDSIELHPANPDYQVQIHRKDQVQIQGKVVALHRQY